MKPIARHGRIYLRRKSVCEIKKKRENKVNMCKHVYKKPKLTRVKRTFKNKKLN